MSALQAQQQVVKVTNVLKAPVEGDIRAGSNDRYTVSPSCFRLRPGESVEITVTLKLDSKFAQRQRATDSGQRDPFYIKVRCCAPSSRILASYKLAFNQPQHVWLCFADEVLRPAVHKRVLLAPGARVQRKQCIEQQQAITSCKVCAAQQLSKSAYARCRIDCCASSSSQYAACWKAMPAT